MMSKSRFMFWVDIFELTVRCVRSSLLLTPSHAKLLESAGVSMEPMRQKKKKVSSVFVDYALGFFQQFHPASRRDLMRASELKRIELHTDSNSTRFKPVKFHE